MELMNPPPYARQLPANTSLDLLRLLKNSRDYPESDACPFALVRVVDAGRGPERDTPYVVPAQSLRDQPSGPAPAEAENKRRAAAARMADEEVASGKCSDVHVNYLRQRLDGVTRFLQSEATAHNPVLYDLIAHAFAVATDDGIPGSLPSGIGGEEHLFAVSFRPSTIYQVLDAQGYAINTSSPLSTLVSSFFELPATGYVAQANANETLKMNLKGHGCVLLFAVRRY